MSIATGAGKSDLIRSTGLEGLKPGATKSDVKGNREDFEKLLKTDGNVPAPIENALEPKLKFSNHAVDRMQQRGISFSKEQLSRVETAVDKAASKGAKEALIIADDKAMIVSVKNNMIVTVMDKEGLKENVFTKIDSTVFA